MSVGATTPAGGKSRGAFAVPRAGFTLIELLIVIAVIAVLAAMILPALLKAKAAARRVECLTRLKQWGQATFSYVDESEGFIPREGALNTGEVFCNNWAQVRHPNSRDVWYNALSPHVGVPPASSYALPLSRAGFYERSSLFHCPSARFPAGTSLSEMAYFSIAMNSQLIEPPTNVPTIAFSRIQQTSKTVLFLDGLLAGEKPVCVGQADIELGQPSATANRFAGMRHSGSGNLVFADGHAESMPGRKVVQTQGPMRGNAILPEVDVIWELE